MFSEDKVKQLKSRNLTVFDNVYYMKVEVSHICNRQCDFCGISRRDPGFMTLGTFENLMEGCPNTLRRMDFSLQGEPLLNPVLPTFIEKARKSHPKTQIMVISNMDKVRREGFEFLLDLYDRGLNIVHADLYDKKQETWFLESLREYSKELELRGIRISDCYATNDNPFQYTGPNKRFLYFLRENKEEDQDQPLSDKKNTTRNFHLWGGNLPRERWGKYTDLTMFHFPMKKVCTEPLKYATIRHNGEVAPCCFDGARTTTMGNINRESKNSIWQSDNFQAIRLSTSLGRRELWAPCLLCNRLSFRIGLTPYWGPAMSEEEIIETVKDCTTIYKEEPMYKNLIQLSQAKQLPEHILKLVEEAI